MTATDLGAPDLTRTLWRCGLPAMAGLAINAVHQSVDGAYLGHLGTGALAAVSLVLPLTGVTAALGVGLGAGTATAIARRLGAGRQEEAGQIASAAMGLCLGLALLAAVVLFLARGPLLTLLGTEADLRPQADTYLRLMAVSAGLGTVQILCDFIAIGEGNARFSLQSLILCFGLNLGLDPLLIFGAGWGVTGAALATIIAQLVTLGVYLWYFHTRRGSVRLHLPSSAWRRIGPVLRVGAPEALALLATTGATLLLYRLAAMEAGVEGLAALGMVLRLLTLAVLPVEGFCLGAQAVLAHAAGRGDTGRLARAVWRLAAVTAGATAAAAVLLVLVPDLALRAFAATPETAALARPALLLLLPALPLMALRAVAQVLLQATERAGTALALGLATWGWLLLPLLAVLVPQHGFLALPLSLSLAAGLAGLAALVLLWRATRVPLTGAPA